MIGYNSETGATCFFESPDAVGDIVQSDFLEFDENGLLDGELPAFGTNEFDGTLLQFLKLIVFLVILATHSFTILGLIKLRCQMTPHKPLYLNLNLRIYLISLFHLRKPMG